MAINYPLLALAVGAFGIGVTEFAPMGMLPVIAADLNVSIPAAGLLVSAYAVGVLVGAPVMTLLFARTPRRTLLVGLMGIFTFGNILSAIADSYTTLFIARVITSFNHGAFFGVGAVVAASVVPPDKRAGAVAAMFSGLTVATVGGVPLAAFVAETVGWRPIFLATALVGLVAMAALRFSLPPMRVEAGMNLRTELRVLARWPVISAMLLTVISASAMFTVFTYIAPILREETGASTIFITAMLTVYGLGLAVGNWLGGRLVDKSLNGTLIASLAGLVVVLLLFSIGMQWAAATVPIIFLWGVASFAIVPPLQTKVVLEAAEAPNLASAINVGAFNLGNAVGAALGGGVIDLGLGYPAVSLAGALASATGLVMLAVMLRRRPGGRGETLDPARQ